jgi:hypothetical protein
MEMPLVVARIDNARSLANKQDCTECCHAVA